MQLKYIWRLFCLAILTKIYFRHNPPYKPNWGETVIPFSLFEVNPPNYKIRHYNYVRWDVYKTVYTRHIYSVSYVYD